MEKQYPLDETGKETKKTILQNIKNKVRNNEY